MTAARARRFDPERRDRIIDAAIGVIAEHGVAGATSRLIAAAADVPLGSLTYHFTGLEELRAAAFERHAQNMVPRYERHFAAVTSRTDLLDALTDLVCGDAGADPREWAIAYELYLAALREPVLRTITDGWMRSSRRILQRYMDATTARGLDALIEGLILHKTLSTRPMSRREIRTALDRALGDVAPGPAS